MAVLTNVEIEAVRFCVDAAEDAYGNDESHVIAARRWVDSLPVAPEPAMPLNLIDMFADEFRSHTETVEPAADAEIRDEQYEQFLRWRTTLRRRLEAGK